MVGSPGVLEDEPVGQSLVEPGGIREEQILVVAAALRSSP